MDSNTLFDTPIAPATCRKYFYLSSALRKSVLTIRPSNSSKAILLLSSAMPLRRAFFLCSLRRWPKRALLHIMLTFAGMTSSSNSCFSSLCAGTWCTLRRPGLSLRDFFNLIFRSIFQQSAQRGVCPTHGVSANATVSLLSQSRGTGLGTSAL